MGLGPLQPMLEFDLTERPVRSVLLTEPIKHVSGVVAVPTGSGLGIEVDHQAITHFEVD
jgi:D-galactarolactone cycloisomerase